MEKVVRVFRSWEEAEAADAQEDMDLSPQQRISIVLELQQRVFPDAAERGFERVCRVTQFEPR